MEARVINQSSESQQQPADNTLRMNRHPSAFDQGRKRVAKFTKKPLKTENNLQP
jgi:hypothetical protein